MALTASPLPTVRADNLVTVLVVGYGLLVFLIPGKVKNKRRW